MSQVTKFVLDNGLTILIYPVSKIPKVAIQLWYGVGSKHEKEGQRGLAHLLEHMIFKGTDILSESDINMISHKLSGSCNAFTSYDYTAYIFDFPKQNWHAALPLLANCMRSCLFKEDLLNAELKTVIQELKMYNDDYYQCLCEKMASAIFAGHPYHHPIIGYKQDLWKINRQGLLDFYYHHYIPNNAILVIVGDVDVQDAFNQAKKSFDQLKPNFLYTPEQFHFQKDIAKHSITMARDVQSPILVYSWVLPGFKEQSGFYSTIASWILAQGKGSRFYKKLVNELEIATDVQTDLYDSFDASLLFVNIDPKDEESIPKIEKVVAQEILSIENDSIDANEIIRAYKQTDIEYVSSFENNQKLAYEIGKLYLATQNENALFENIPEDKESIHENTAHFLKENFSISGMHKGLILPFKNQEKHKWLALQEKSDKEDERILSRKVRETAVECGAYVEQLTSNEATVFSYPRAQKKILANGITLLWHSSALTPKIDIILDLKVRHYYDQENKQGLINFLFEMLIEGAGKLNGQELADAFESRGMSITLRPGTITLSLLKEDFQTGLDLLSTILTQATFAEKNIEKVRTRITNELVQFWDNPTEFVGQLVREKIYKNHPYHKNMFGSLESLKKITKEDLLNSYKLFVSPVQAHLAIVGDLEEIDVVNVVWQSLGKWQGNQIPEIIFPLVEPVHKETIVFPINRDQMVLAFAGLSVSRTDPKYDSLLLFDQIFAGGVLGSMSSYLFQIREQTGLFYTIGGSLVAGADEQPGFVFIRTVVSHDNSAQAEQLIEQTIENVKNKITQSDLEHARNAIVNSLVDSFESNFACAQAFLFLDRFNLPEDYFDNRLKQLQLISIDEIKNSVTRVLDINSMVKLKIGRAH